MIRPDNPFYFLHDYHQTCARIAWERDDIKRHLHHRARSEDLRKRMMVWEMLAEVCETVEKNTKK